MARHVEDAGWKLRIGNRGPEVAPNLFQDAVDKIETQQAEIERLRAVLDVVDAQVAAYMNGSIGSSRAIQTISLLLDAEEARRG